MAIFTKQVVRHTHEIEIKYFPRVSHSGGGPRNEREIDLDNLDHSMMESIARTKRTIKDYARNNDFDYFVTLTLDPKKYDSFNIDVVYRVVKSFLQRIRRRSDVEPKYLLVPEYHADKAKIHLHGYIKGKLALKKTDLTYKGKRVYNLYDWDAGFSSAVKIGKSVDDTLRCSSYITKYVTKDMLVSFNKKRYWCSRNLSKPSLIKEEVIVSDTMTDILAHQLPTNLPTNYSVYHNDYYVVITFKDEKKCV